MPLNTQNLLKGLSSLMSTKNSTENSKEQEQNEEELKNVYSLSNQVKAISSLNQQGQNVGGMNLLGSQTSTSKIASLLNNYIVNSKNDVIELKPYLIIGSLVMVALIVAEIS